MTYIDRQYEELCAHIMASGTDRDDRTGTGTRGVFGAQLRFDLSDAAVPVLTTKKVAWRLVVAELLWIVSGDTNIKALTDQNVHIWDEWRRPYTGSREIVIVDQREPVAGAEYHGNFSRRGMNASRGSIDDKLAEIWVRLMKRCYDPSHHHYRFYGEVGVTVHPDWHDPQVFINQVKLLPHWEYKLSNWNNFELDKDYFGSGQYGLHTSVWLSSEENSLYTRAAIPVEVEDAEGNVMTYLSQSIAARETGMSRSSMCRFITDGVPTILKGNNRAFIGWEFRQKESLEGKLFRHALIEDGDLGPVYGAMWRSWPDYDGGTIDQLTRLIHDLRVNPDSRRHIITAWNPALLGDQALPPCHAFFQFHVANGKLSCQLYQRSADMFLGVPFNIASYALLTHLIAREVGLDAGEFIWTGGDCHIYSNHFDQMHEQLSRDSRPFPSLHIAADEGTSLFGLVTGDLQLEGYDPHPPIKAPVSV